MASLALLPRIPSTSKPVRTRVLWALLALAVNGGVLGGLLLVGDAEAEPAPARAPVGTRAAPKPPADSAAADPAQAQAPAPADRVAADEPVDPPRPRKLRPRRLMPVRDFGGY